MRALKKFAVILGTCAIVACGALMPAIASTLQDNWLHAQTGTRDMELLNSLDLSDPSVMDAFWVYSNAPSSLPVRQGKNLSAQEALDAARDVYDMMLTSGLVSCYEPPNSDSSAYPELLIVDSGDMVTALVWRCYWWGEDGSGYSIVIDDVTGKMLSFQLQTLLSDDSAVTPQPTAERWLDFMRSYYGEPDIGMVKSDYAQDAWTLTFPMSHGGAQSTQDVSLFITYDIVSFH